MQLYPLVIMHNSIQFTDVYLDEFELNTNNPNSFKSNASNRKFCSANSSLHCGNFFWVPWVIIS